MKKIFIPALIACSFLFSSCEDVEYDYVVHELAYEIVPAWQKISNFQLEMKDAELRNIKWINMPGESEEKTKQVAFVNDTYPKLKKDLQDFFKAQSSIDRKGIDSLFIVCDQQIAIYKDVMRQLSSIAEYNDPMIMLPLQSVVLDNDGECTLLSRNIDNMLKGLSQRYEGKMRDKKDQLVKFESK